KRILAALESSKEHGSAAQGLVRAPGQTGQDGRIPPGPGPGPADPSQPAPLPRRVPGASNWHAPPVRTPRPVRLPAHGAALGVHDERAVGPAKPAPTAPPGPAPATLRRQRLTSVLVVAVVLLGAGSVAFALTRHTVSATAGDAYRTKAGAPLATRGQ